MDCRKRAGDCAEQEIRISLLKLHRGLDLEDVGMRSLGGEQYPVRLDPFDQQSCFLCRRRAGLAILNELDTDEEP